MKMFYVPQSQKLISVQVFNKSVQGGFFLGNLISVHCTFIRDARVISWEYLRWKSDLPS